MKITKAQLRRTIKEEIEKVREDQDRSEVKDWWANLSLSEKIELVDSGEIPSMDDDFWNEDDWQTASEVYNIYKSSQRY